MRTAWGFFFGTLSTVLQNVTNRDKEFFGARERNTRGTVDGLLPRNTYGARTVFYLTKRF
jgi:hypothetical protein